MIPKAQGDEQNAGKVFDPSKLSFEIKNHIVVLRNEDSYTKNWSIKAPHQVAVAVKQQYKLKTGQELHIDTQSLGLEIYVHAFLFDYGILKSHTDKADCGEYDFDWNRKIWDGAIIYVNCYPYTHNTH